MTDKQWPPEPWSLSEWDWFNDANGEMIGEPVDAIESYHLSLPELNRIIACVNACAGVPTEKLRPLNKETWFCAPAIDMFIQIDFGLTREDYEKSQRQEATDES